MLKTKDFEEVYTMLNPNDSFKEFLREINPLLVSKGGNSNLNLKTRF